MEHVGRDFVYASTRLSLNLLHEARIQGNRLCGLEIGDIDRDNLPLHAPLFTCSYE
jgi:hypothetical protein